MAVPEGAAIVRAGAAALRGVTEKAGSSQEWPNFHAAMMELHEILDEWLTASEATMNLYLNGRGMSPEDIKKIYRMSNISFSFFRYPSAGFVEQVEKDLTQLMNPRAPMLQKWSRGRRRKAARPTLRSMMKIYRPDILDDFHSAVQGRSAWIRENRKAVKQALKDGSLSWEDVWRAPVSTQTVVDLEHLKAVVASVILEKYPLGGTAHSG
ncbi:hypothetical protein AB0N60_36725 [Streptomyces microflavus]|uniref:hypothetical protein n=1 Tax=Streptomyces microflavus TaxID=1919 RepID=UPI0034386629